jgi:predicted nuclease of predicted toxin-antitoxin system
MKLLLDECTPKRLKKDFVGHNVFTIDEAGFKGMKNGKLLRIASDDGFEVLITVDQNIQHQQNLLSFPISVLVLIAKSNRYEDLQPLVDDALDELTRIKIGEVVSIEKTF